MCLAMVQLRIARDSRIIDEHARNRDIAGADRAGLDDLLHLSDHNATAVVHGLSDRQGVQPGDLFAMGQVAQFVDHGASDERHIEVHGFVPQTFLAIELHDIDVFVDGDIRLRRGIETTTVNAWVHEGPQPHGRKLPGTARCDRPIQR